MRGWIPRASICFVTVVSVLSQNPIGLSATCLLLCVACLVEMHYADAAFRLLDEAQDGWLRIVTAMVDIVVTLPPESQTIEGKVT